jgi:hypothetical protein
MCVDIITLPDNGERPLVRKAQLWRHTPYQYSVFIDADTIILENPLPLADLAKAHQFVVHQFVDWKTKGPKIAGRIKQWTPVIGKENTQKALEYGAAINTGIFAFSRNAEILEEWERITREGMDKNCTRRLVDEVAAQVLLHNYPHTVVDQQWGLSGKYGTITDDTKIIHYHGSKHVFDTDNCEVWKQAYEDMSTQFAHLIIATKANGDRRFARWYSSRDNWSRFRGPNTRQDLTVVTAVNPAYLGKFTKNFALWMADDQLKDQRFVVFTNRFRRNDKRIAFLKQYDNVRVIPWKFPLAGDNVRERMLSAFVYGTAEHVKTTYWMKLDGDATPLRPYEFPNYSEYTITGHRCGYTCTKGENKTGHFLNHLDDHKGGEPAFPADIQAKRYRHTRLASYCWFELTAFTRSLAAWCGDRLPVPSHDTTACYYAEHVLGLKVGQDLQRMNMKRWLKP